VFFSTGYKFERDGSWTPYGHGTDGWYVGDFNGDRRDDIFRYLPGVSGAQVFQAEGVKFVNVGSWTGAGHGAHGWYVGDFDGDGNDDIFRYLPGVSGAAVFLATCGGGILSRESLMPLDEDMLLDVNGSREMEMSYQEEVEFLAPFMERMTMGEDLSIYEIKHAYEEAVEHIVRMPVIRHLLHRHGYWDLVEEFLELDEDRRIKK
jgi:hypothetical protein